MKRSHFHFNFSNSARYILYRFVYASPYASRYVPALCGSVALANNVKSSLTSLSSANGSFTITDSKRLNDLCNPRI